MNNMKKRECIAWILFPKDKKLPLPEPTNYGYIAANKKILENCGSYTDDKCPTKVKIIEI